MVKNVSVGNPNPSPSGSDTMPIIGEKGWAVGRGVAT